jgi:hypothetical protein
MIAGLVYASIRAQNLQGAALERLRVFGLYKCLEQGKCDGGKTNRGKLTEAAVDRTEQIGDRNENAERDAVVCGWEEAKRKTKRRKLNSYKATKLTSLAGTPGTITTTLTFSKTFTQ